MLLSTSQVSLPSQIGAIELMMSRRDGESCANPNSSPTAKHLYDGIDDT
jgi:hypothetical protein